MKPTWLLAALLTLSVAPTLADDIPAELTGHWAENGACDNVEKSVTITADKMAFGSTAPTGIIFTPDESPSGNGAIHWAEEGVVDNFEYDPTGDQLLYNAEGWDMGIAPVPYKRCK